MRVHSNHPDVPYAEQLIATAGANIPIYPSKIARHINVGGSCPSQNSQREHINEKLQHGAVFASESFGKDGRIHESQEVAKHKGEMPLFCLGAVQQRMRPWPNKWRGCGP